MSRNIIPINDGYTRQGYIEAVPRLHDELVFEYRPMIPEEVEQLNAALDRTIPVQTIHRVAAAVLKHLKSWSEVDEEGKPVPLSFDAIRRLPYPMLSNVRRIIEGTMPSDLRPGAVPESEEFNEYAASLDAVVAGKLPGIEQVVADQKNLKTG